MGKSESGNKKKVIVDFVANVLDNIKNAKGDEYNDTPDYCCDLPSCPKCGETMKYSYSKSEFKCPKCKNIMDENDWSPDMDDGDSRPWVCTTCGGPWPDCITSCKMFDD